MCPRRTLIRRLPIPIRCAVRPPSGGLGGGVPGGGLLAAAGCSAAAWVGVRCGVPARCRVARTRGLRTA